MERVDKMIRHYLRIKWHRLIMRAFRQHFVDELNEAIHPDFGWIWREEELGGQAYKKGYEDGKYDRSITYE